MDQDIVMYFDEFTGEWIALLSPCADGGAQGDLESLARSIRAEEN